MDYLDTEKQILEMLSAVKAIITDSHVVYTSGMHGSAYVNKDAAYPHTHVALHLGLEIAKRFAHEGVDTVVAPAVGGVILSQWTAHSLSLICGYEVFGVYAEKETVVVPDHEFKHRSCFAETGNFVIKRGYGKLVSGKRVLVLDDILTTGTSARKVVEAVRAIGGNVIGVGAICNRGGITPANLANVPKLIALVNIKLDAYNEDACPLCKSEVPINTEVGKGRDFLARIKKP